ncbi:MAG TPA: type 1 glutamine amidotransferase domain-containing protein [Noviherbaspirillum sp.]|nr:type 1 glutamine amidotransferase domain-containing protein [Noviherbaspirillum sp.]
MSKRILVITTSNAVMGNTGKPTGIWAEELAVPYYAFIDAGFDVEIASPKGGAIPFDPSSIKQPGQNDPEVERLLADETVQEKIKSTRIAAELDASAFDAVFFPGGHGTMWDLPHDAGVTRTVETAFARGKLIGAVCHGPAGLVSAKRGDGRSIVEGMRINSFTDAEEKEVGLIDVVPFRLESRLRELGGRFEDTGNWQPFAVRDGQLVTGQNPQSSALVAQKLIEALQTAA